VAKSAIGLPLAWSYSIRKQRSRLPHGIRSGIYLDALRYEEQDGKFDLKRDAIEGVKTQADLDRVNDTLKKERKARADPDAKLKRFEALGDTDPDEVLRAADEVESLRAQVGSADAESEDTIQKRVAGEVARAINPLQRELDRFKSEAETHRRRADGLAGQTRRSTLESELTQGSGAQGPRRGRGGHLPPPGPVRFGEDGKVVTRADLKGLSAGLDRRAGSASGARTGRIDGRTARAAEPGAAAAYRIAPPTSSRRRRPNLTSTSQLTQTDRSKA
jgi:hypothetical protein